MYVPEAFAERELGVLHAWMRSHPFALLVTATSGGGFEATHLPLLLDEARGAHGTLLGHVARGNRHWRHFDGNTAALVVFSGPHAYVSPRGYQTPGAPTWNYVAVHAEGVPRVLSDPAAVRDILERLTEVHDGAGGYEAIPEEVVTKLAPGVVAFELPIDRVVGKKKLSQNRSDVDRAGIAAELRASGSPDALEIASLVEQVSKP
jgi:transcriptional regulator